VDQCAVSSKQAGCVFVLCRRYFVSWPMHYV